MPARSRPVMVVAATAGCIAVITAVGACSQSSAGGSSAGRFSTAGGTALQAGPAHGAPAAAPSAPTRGAAGGAADSSTGYSGQLTAVIGTGSKIRTAQMTVQVKRGSTVAAQADAAEAIATGVGGEVDADDRTSGRFATATLVLRVPPDQLDGVLGQLSRLGHELGRQLSTRDVTSRVADVNSRVASARREIARLRILYGHASKISDIITIESELASRESSLESLQAQQRALAAETSLATITLNLTSPPQKKTPPPAVKHHHDSGFLAGLKSGWHAFVTGVTAIATAVGAILPFAILLLVLGLVMRVLWPRLRPARSPAPTPAPEQ